MQVLIPTAAVKQDNVSSSKKDTLPTNSSSPGKVVTSAMTPVHVEIKKEPNDDISPGTSKVSDAGDTPNSISGESSCSSVLDAQGIINHISPNLIFRRII